MPSTTYFSFNVFSGKLHMACPRYAAGGALKMAGSRAVCAQAGARASRVSARRSRLCMQPLSLLAQRPSEQVAEHGAERASSCATDTFQDIVVQRHCDSDAPFLILAL